jgi:ubiquinone/menaquinone biosynthesis C-methylase UbiE
MSSVYDWLTSAEAHLRDRLLRLMAVRSGERILDLGTGTGMALLELARNTGSDGLVLGLDLSSGMLDRARKKIGGTATAGVGLIRGDAAHLPLRAGALQAVVMSFTLELFDTPEIPEVLAECRRVLGNQGRLAVSSLAARPQRNAMVRAYEWLHDRFPAWLDCRPIPLQSFLADSGFLIEKAEATQLWGLPVDLVVSRARSPGAG